MDPVADQAADQRSVEAVVDRDGLLLSADPSIERLNGRAGGTLNAPIAIPQFATVARLAWRLGIVVARGVLVADDDIDLHLWVRAQPEGERVRLSVSGWRDTAAWRPSEPVTFAADADWRWETDAALRLSFVSLDAAVRAGVDAFALLGQPLTMLFALDSDEDGTLPILDAQARRRAFVDQPARVRATGQAVVLSAQVRHDATGDFAGLIGASRAVEIGPTPLIDALPASFAIGLDKALRKPLARIVAHADSINAHAGGPIAPDYADYAADIANAGRHLLDLVDDLVDLQSVERPDFALTTASIDLADVARRAAGLLGVRATQAGVAVDRPGETATCPARGNFRRASQVAVNMIGNALRYSPKGEAVVVTVGIEQGRALLVVADRGKGIAPADQARIFDKFERVDSSEVGGNGLGLYIARRLARAMGGDLTVDSAPCSGATFTFSLPA